MIIQVTTGLFYYLVPESLILGILLAIVSAECVAIGFIYLNLTVGVAFTILNLAIVLILEFIVIQPTDADWFLMSLITTGIVFFILEIIRAYGLSKKTVVGKSQNNPKNHQRQWRRPHTFCWCQRRAAGRA